MIQVETLLLDTDVCIEILRGNPEPVESYAGARFMISSITRFEILSGLRKRKSRKLENRAKAFLRATETLPFDDDAAASATTIRIALEDQGTPIGAYDTLLAGHAVACGLPILTGNISGFRRVKNLQVLTWR